MKILQIVSGMGVNGAVLQCVALCKALAARGHKVHLICRPDSWTAAQQLPEGMRILANKQRRWSLRDVRTAAAWIKEQQVDIVHTHQSRAHVFGLLLRCFTRTPCVATAHARHFQPHWRWNNFVIANSAATYEFHRRWNRVPPSRMQVVHYLVDVERFSEPRDEARRRLRNDWNAADEDLLVGIVGDVIRRKGQLLAIRAWAEVVRQVPHSKLVLVGEEKDMRYVRRMKAEAERLGIAQRIVWAGYLTDVPAVMHALDLCVSAAFEEALGLTILEAMAASRGVVATRVGGVPENVVHNETGLLVPPGKPGPLADAIIRLLLDAKLREACGERGRELVRTKYNTARQLDELEGIYRQVLADTPR